MTYAESLKLLEGRSEARVELGLERVRAHLRELGDPQEKVPAIHVAGTNGKGSTCALLASVLRGAGYRTGLYTSPHLRDVRERIRLDGTAISEADFARLLARSVSLPSAGPLTYFELLTAVAFQYFSESRSEVVVLETGLGGRLDATNVVERPALTIITSIDLDHMRFLGSTVAEIAAEKAGILKPGVPCVCGALGEEALGVLQAAAFEKLAVVDRIEEPPPVESVRVDWEDGLQLVRVPQYGELFLRLLGLHQRQNAAVVLKAVPLLQAAFPRLGPEAVEVGFKQVDWPGRFDVRPLLLEGRKRVLVLDGAHNPEAARVFRDTLSQSPFAGSLLILGFLKDKDVPAILRELKPLLGSVIVVPPPSPRALGPEETSRLVREAVPYAQIRTAETAESALKLWKEDSRQVNAAVTGSFYLVADALRALEAWR